MNPPWRLLAAAGWGHRANVWERLTLPGAAIHPRALPGHEASPPSQCSLETAAAAWGGYWDLALGWSLGGIALLHALECNWIRPRALILIATPPSFLARPGYPAGMAAGRLEAFRSGLAEDIRGTLRRFYTLQFQGDKAPRSHWARVRERYLAYGAGAPVLSAWLQVLASVDRITHPPTWAIPVLLLYGREDVIVPPAASHPFQDGGPQVATAVIPGAGHAPHITHPQETERRIGDFLRTMGP